MIISASRRTDIMRYFFDWFLERLKEGFVLVRNPMTARQVSRVPLNPDVVDCIVFWTKNPAPALDRLDEMEPYPYYVQYTVNPYGGDIECNLPPKPELLDTFRRLSDRLGPDRVVWRYSPVLYSAQYTEERHKEAFAEFAGKLQGYTKQCKLSFLDLYSKIRKRMYDMDIHGGIADQNSQLARELAGIGKTHGIEVSACGSIDFAAAGIPPAKCIDDQLISKITGYAYDLKKDTGQRDDCYCVQSVDIGAYDTCAGGCQYCYANFSADTVRRALRGYSPHSPLLCGTLQPGDKVTGRAAVSNRMMQMSMFGPGKTE